MSIERMEQVGARRGRRTRRGEATMRRWTALRRSLAALLLLGAGAGACLPAAAQERTRPLPVPVTGATVAVDLAGGGALRGELIQATEGSLLLLSETGLRSVDFAEVSGIRARRHGMDTGKGLRWVAVGALVSGLGLTIACSQVEDTECGGVFFGVALSWALVGIPLTLGMNNSGWERLPIDDAWLRSRARFPQGAPAEFLEGRRAREAGR